MRINKLKHWYLQCEPPLHSLEKMSISAQKDLGNEPFERNSLEDGGLELLTKEKVKLKKPNMYCVILLNDDYTPMDFVVLIIQKIFHKPLDEAARLMLDVHNKGQSLMGIFTYDAARTKVEQVLALAEQNEHPLQCVMEAEESSE